VSDEQTRAYEKHLYDALHAASRDYDQAILTVAGGTLALSVTFAGDISPTPQAGSQELLVRAWLALGASIVAIVISFATSQRAIRARIRTVDAPSPDMTRTERMTEALNVLAGGLLVLGLALIGTYALANT
jgi:hypothetical protein